MRLEIDRSTGAEWLQWIKQFEGNIYHSLEWVETWRSDRASPDAAMRPGASAFAGSAR